MKRIIAYSLMAFAALHVSAQSLLSFGARGGLDFMLPQSEQQAQSKLGYIGAFDIGYTYYWPVNKCDWGIHTGASIGYAKSGAELTCKQQFTNYDYLNTEMLYTTSGTFNMSISRMFVEVPLMAALRHQGFVLQIGVKAQYAFLGKTKQDITNASIDAYYVPYGFHVIDEEVTGVVHQGDLRKEYDGGAPAINLLVAGRIGYEAKTEHNGRVGILAFVDYNVWNNRSIVNTSTTIIAVSPITDAANPIPTVTINNAIESVVTRMNPLQVGLALYYAIEFKPRE